ncbi:preprotein translocase subunit YajC [Peptoniphilus sp. GNH]|nr:preprotein translocase, YajC subunit [Clostridiales bacterium KA00134]UHR03124.1 preprotein translocase subunit YajC [Peptoniphilus sp. GNH]
MPENTRAIIYNILPFLGIIVFFYIFVIKPQKKKENEMRNMRDAIKAGDKVITIGGIVGKVVSVKGDTIIIQTTGEASKIEMTKWGINSIIGGENETH